MIVAPYIFSWPASCVIGEPDPLSTCGSLGMSKSEFVVPLRVGAGLNAQPLTPKQGFAVETVRSKLVR